MTLFDERLQELFAEVELEDVRRTLAKVRLASENVRFHAEIKPRKDRQLDLNRGHVEEHEVVLPREAETFVLERFLFSEFGGFDFDLLGEDLDVLGSVFGVCIPPVLCVGDLTLLAEFSGEELADFSRAVILELIKRLQGGPNPSASFRRTTIRIVCEALKEPKGGRLTIHLRSLLCLQSILHRLELVVFRLKGFHCVLEKGTVRLYFHFQNGE
jgi:hypothetical protein